MHILRYAATLTALGALSGLVACSDPLEVENEDNPDRGRVLARPSDVEGLAASLYQRITSATLGAIARTNTGMMTASLMNGSGLANNGLGPRGNMPRGQIDNSRGNPYPTENYQDFNIHSQVARTASDILARAKGEGFSLGSAANDDRMIAFTHFNYGVALGNLALVYDSAGIPRPADAATDVPELVGYPEVMAAALQELDSALLYAAKPGTAALPASWLNGNAMPMAEFQKLVHSYKARLRANVARTPAENEAVDWNAVVADAAAGITGDFEIAMDPVNGWDVAWLAGTLHFRDVNWHQMTPYIIGMADTSGAYADWLATPRDQRTPFLIRTPDERFPSGDTRAAQNAVGQGVLPAGVYFRNRDPGLDNPALGWQNSQYDHYRWRAFANANRIGRFPVFTRAENDMLAAEGYIRTGQVAQATPLIDRYRVPNGLPALTGRVSDTEQPVPGGNACVPQVPASATSTTLECGNVLEAMKWEKRIESAYTGYGVWFFDSRRWGDLPEGTAIQWPVPFQELDARLKPLYNLGGAGNPGAAAPSNYGFGTGNR